MMRFFNRTRLERLRVVGPEPGLLWTGLKALDRRVGDRTTGSGCGTHLQKQETRRAGGDFARDRSDA